MVGIEKRLINLEIENSKTNKLLRFLIAVLFPITVASIIFFGLLINFACADENSISGRPDIRPIDNNKIVSIVRGFTSTHFGIDYSCYVDTEIKATGSGKVVFARYVSGYGNCIIIKHDWIDKNGKAQTAYTVYGHLSEFLVLRGQSVLKGQVIALSGSTGRSDGPHLHYELRNANNKPIFNGTYQVELKQERLSNKK